jgi:hypothetical protein
MAEKAHKRATNPGGVLGTLPASRPERIGRPRRVKPEPAPPKPLGPPKGTVLVTTAVRATGELAQIGFVVGGQVVKRTLDRLKP